jgi:hypothetical protein
VRNLQVPNRCRKTPTIALDLRASTASKFTKITSAIPDPGAEVSVAGLDVLNSLGLVEANLSCAKYDLVQADRSSTLLSIGQLELTIRYGPREAQCTVVFCPAVRGMLLSWVDCKSLGILHYDYPNPLPIGNRLSVGSIVNQSATNLPPDPSSLLTGTIPEKPTEESIDNIHAAIVAHYDAVVDQSQGLRCIDGPAMTIELTDDFVPYYVNGAHPIAYADRPEVKQILDDLLAAGIIARVIEPSEWAAPLVVLRKSDGKLRVCVDHTKLNRYVRRPSHPVRPRDAVSEIDSDAVYFSCFDAVNGYFQIPLDEASQHLTVFMTPWGRYKFQRASMGFCCSSDEFNRRADAAFGHLSNTVRVVDDLLRFDRSFPAHVRGVCSVL